MSSSKNRRPKTPWCAFVSPGSRSKKLSENAPRAKPPRTSRASTRDFSVSSSPRLLHLAAGDFSLWRTAPWDTPDRTPRPKVPPVRPPPSVMRMNEAVGSPQTPSASRSLVEHLPRHLPGSIPSTRWRRITLPWVHPARCSVTFRLQAVGQAHKASSMSPWRMASTSTGAKGTARVILHGLPVATPMADHDTTGQLSFLPGYDWHTYGRLRRVPPCLAAAHAVALQHQPHVHQVFKLLRHRIIQAHGFLNQGIPYRCSSDAHSLRATPAHNPRAKQRCGWSSSPERPESRTRSWNAVSPYLNSRKASARTTCPSYGCRPPSSSPVCPSWPPAASLPGRSAPDQILSPSAAKLTEQHVVSLLHLLIDLGRIFLSHPQ